MLIFSCLPGAPNSSCGSDPNIMSNKCCGLVWKTKNKCCSMNNLICQQIMCWCSGLLSGEHVLRTVLICIYVQLGIVAVVWCIIHVLIGFIHLALRTLSLFICHALHSMTGSIPAITPFLFGSINFSSLDKQFQTMGRFKMDSLSSSFSLSPQWHDHQTLWHFLLVVLACYHQENWIE